MDQMKPFENLTLRSGMSGFCALKNGDRTLCQKSFTAKKTIPLWKCMAVLLMMMGMMLLVCKCKVMKKKKKTKCAASSSSMPSPCSEEEQNA